MLSHFGNHVGKQQRSTLSFGLKNLLILGLQNPINLHYFRYFYWLWLNYLLISYNQVLQYLQLYITQVNPTMKLEVNHSFNIKTDLSLYKKPPFHLNSALFSTQLMQ